jgi:hypothetical protein
VIPCAVALAFRAATSSSGSLIVKFMAIFARLTRDRKYTRYGNVSPFLPHRVVATRVAPRPIGAPHEPGQPLCHRVPSVAGSGLSGTGTPACAQCMECISPSHRQECLCYQQTDSRWLPLVILFYAGIIEACANRRNCFPIKSA